MKGLTAILAALVLAVPAIAQERYADVRLDDGRVIQGHVTSMTLEFVDVHVGDKILRIPASRVRSFQFQEEGEEPASDPVPASAESTPAPSEEAGRAVDPAAASPQGPASAPAGETAPADPEATAEQPYESSERPAENLAGRPPVAQEVSRPVGPIWKQRLAGLAVEYPWLSPAMPSHWVSLGLLLFVGIGLSVHFSVRIAGADAPELGRSVMLAVLYIVMGGLQAGLVPVESVTVALMLLANTVAALLLLRLLFGLQRFGAVVAWVMQLGFSVCMYGILELVTALLGLVGATA